MAQDIITDREEGVYDPGLAQRVNQQYQAELLGRSRGVYLQK